MQYNKLPRHGDTDQDPDIQFECQSCSKLFAAHASAVVEVDAHPQYYDMRQNQWVENDAEAVRTTTILCRPCQMTIIADDTSYGGN